MQNNSTVLSLRIFFSSTDKYKDELMYEHIVVNAKNYVLAGATVLKGIFECGASSMIHSYKFLEISEKLPVVVEITDEGERVLSFMRQSNMY